MLYRARLFWFLVPTGGVLTFVDEFPDLLHLVGSLAWLYV